MDSRIGTVLLKLSRTSTILGFLKNTLVLLLAFSTAALRADLAIPGWYDEGAGVADWHYRVPIGLPGSAANNSTIRADIDFANLLSQLGVNSATVDFDESSVRVVRSNGSLASTQEFTDLVYAGSLDGAGNARGEVQFLLQDAPAAGNYYLYFDIVSNGAKPPVPANPINGNFEQSVGSTPTGWIVSAVNAGGAQNNEVYRTNTTTTLNVAAGCGTGAANNVDNSPNNSGGVATGQAWHLLGYRDNCEDGAGNERIRLSRNIAVPSGAAAGNLEFFFQVQSWDGIQNNNNYDWFIFYVNGTAVNHNNLSISNVTNPQLRIDNNRLGRQGYSGTLRDHGWKRATLNLSAFQGSTINFRIESRHSASDNNYRGWIKIDDVSWSVQAGTLGTPQGFGVNLIAPNDTAVSAPSQYTATQILSIQATVDASPQSIDADVYDALGAQVATAIPLFDDGSHGDTIAGDGIFSNDGSVGSEPTYTIQAGDPGGNTWMVRVFARDASVSGIGSTNGLIHRSGQPTAPENSTNYFNIDEQTFTVVAAQLEMLKTVRTLRDPVNVLNNPKAVPGAWLQYELSVTNRGPDGSDTDSIVVIDALPPNVDLCVTAACSGDPTPIFVDDSASPEPTGLTYLDPSVITFSTDGATFNNNSSPDAEGFDSQITHLRVTPLGAMNPPGAGGDPVFIIRYVIRLN